MSIPSDILLQHVPQIIYQADPDGQIVFINNFWHDYTGCKKSEVSAFMNYIHPEDLEFVSSTFEKARKARRVWEEQFRLRNRDGEYRWHLGRSRPLFNEHGEVTGWVGVSYDIHKKKEAQEALKLTQTIMSQAFVQSPSFLAILKGRDFVFEEANAKYFEIIGNREILGKPIREALPEITNQGFISILEDVYDHNKSFTGNEVPALLNGQQKYVDFNYVPLHDAKGKVFGIMVHGIDVTEKVLNRKAIEESEKRLRDYADSMPQMAFIADGTGAITYFNKRWYEYVDGMEGTEGWGWKERPIHHPDDFERTVKSWESALKSQMPYEIEYRLRRHDGVYRWHLGRAFPSRDESGQVVAWFGTNTDIHDFKLLQEKLEQALRVRDDFISIASHELKTPLTTLKLQLQILERNIVKGQIDVDRLEAIAKTLNRQFTKLTDLIDNMLDISRLNNGKLDLFRETSNISALTEEIFDHFKQQFIEAGVHASLDLEGDVFCQVDALRLEQVITNLLTNAIKYGEKAPVKIVVKKDTDHAYIIVNDKGPGISSEHLSKIFDQFHRLNNGNISGLGLGLFISQEIVRAHGGVITAESNSTDGTTFKIALPCH